LSEIININTNTSNTSSTSFKEQCLSREEKIFIKMPAIVLEKPKLSRPMWNSLKSHIIRERQRKKQGYYV